MNPTLVTPATGYPVTLAEAKAQCRVTSSTEDTHINALIAAATAHVENYTGRSIEPQTWEYTLPAFANEILLPKGPILSVDSVTYLDAAGVSQTLSASTYVEDLAGERIVLASGHSWPATAVHPAAVTIRYTAGYDDIPASVLHAIKILIGTWYAAREAVGSGKGEIVELPFAVTSLLSNHRAYI